MIVKMTDEEMTPAKIRNEYDALAAEYDKKIWFDQSILGLGRLRKQLMSKASGKILDVACGTGSNLPFFAKGSEITGIDISPGMLAQARKRADRLRLNVKLIAMDAEKLDFPDKTFATVVSALSTCTFPDPIKALREMQRVCRTDGQILLLEHGHSKHKWLAKMQDKGAVQHYHDNAGCRWNQEPLNLVKEAGLNVISSQRSMLGVFHSIVASPRVGRTD